ncbi:uncharacterized protein cubi_00239 [Cryptosporidium ubiquitum]|uniref:GDP-fucose protein O-fucosyltransferase 2 n=1 Tax=Cryptosporidium ubiquitum TaxID=857276 RepID=A0A1J4MKF9_9CRYT|nr:uncharacterized protein cubi_00239 [Cryptosporidium ubiquitum]OII74686.1 hypothetical protein cubi_00239 [Cryptosporidium ubiquitum]
MDPFDFPIVIDTGQFQTRIGSSANKLPQVIIDTVLFEKTKVKEIVFDKNVFSDKLRNNKSCIEKNSLSSSNNWDSKKKSLLVNEYQNITRPFNYLDGLDWNLLETFWTDLVSREMCYDTTMCPVLLSEPHNAPFDFQDHSMEFFFESLSVPSFNCISQELLSVNAIQRGLPYIFQKKDNKGSVGIVVHFSDSSIRILPIASGYLLSEYIGVVNLGGYSITDSLLDHFGINFKSSSPITHQNIDSIKSYGIFDGIISNMIIPCLCDEIISVVKKCPVDYLRLLLKNIIFIGGASINSLLSTNFQSYFKIVLKRSNISLEDINVINLSNSSNIEEKILGTCSTWLGGSYFAKNIDMIGCFFNKEQNKCVNILNNWNLRESIGNKCPDWMADVCWVIYDVKDGEGFYLQRNVFDRMALVVSNLNEAMYLKKEAKFAVLILPPFCNIAHWTYDSKRRLPWSTFFSIQQNGLPILEYDIYKGFIGMANIGVDVIGLNFDWNNNSFKSNTLVEHYKKSEISELKHFNSRCMFNRYIGNDNVVFAGHCELIKVKNAICLSFFKLMRPREVSEEIYKIFESNKKQKKFQNYLIKYSDGILVPWPFELKKYKVLDIISYNDNVKKHAQLYMSSNTFFDKKKPYISVHLRRNDFVFVRNDDIPTFHQVVDRLSQLSKDLNIKRVVISTDSNESEKNELMEIFSRRNLDLHIINIKEKLEDGVISAVSQVILLNGEYFIGTKESRFSFSVAWDCILSARNGFKSNFSENFNKCNEIFCGKAGGERSICREHSDRLPIFNLDVT